MRHSISRATSAIAMLHRHGRVPSDEEVMDAYRELLAAKIERALCESPELLLDPTRASFLVALLLHRTLEPMQVCRSEHLCLHNNHLSGEHTRVHRNGGFMETCDDGALCAAADLEFP